MITVENSDPHKEIITIKKNANIKDYTFSLLKFLNLFFIEIKFTRPQYSH